MSMFDAFITSGDLVREHLGAVLAEAASVGEAAAPLRVAYVSHEDHVRRAVWSPGDLARMGFTLAASVDEADIVLANGVQVCFKGTASAAPCNLEDDADDWGPIRRLLTAAAQRSLPLLVANPDREVVRSGGQVVNCPGLLIEE